MKKNMGTIDRILRSIIAIMVAVFYFSGQISGLAALILGILAVVFVLTSFVSFCPLYQVLKISTAKKN